MKESPDKGKITRKITPIIITIAIFAAFGLVFQSGMFSGGMDAVTMFGNGEPAKRQAITKIIPSQKEGVGNALFDIILTIPEKSKVISSDENLLISVELVNFGKESKTDVDIAYIITNGEGDVVLIEHEKRVVQTQDQFLKEIKLPDTYGKHKILVELLYSNTSAITSGEFFATLY